MDESRKAELRATLQEYRNDLSSGEWLDGAVFSYVRDVGELLDALDATPDDLCRKNCQVRDAVEAERDEARTRNTELEASLAAARDAVWSSGTWTKRPTVCGYCDGHGNSSAGGACGFCIGGVPLDTQEDWDNSWGQTVAAMNRGEGRSLPQGESFRGSNAASLDTPPHHLSAEHWKANHDAQVAIKQRLHAMYEDALAQVTQLRTALAETVEKNDTYKTGGHRLHCRYCGMYQGYTHLFTCPVEIVERGAAPPAPIHSGYVSEFGAAPPEMLEGSEELRRSQASGRATGTGRDEPDGSDERGADPSNMAAPPDEPCPTCSDHGFINIGSQTAGTHRSSDQPNYREPCPDCATPDPKDQ